MSCVVQVKRVIGRRAVLVFSPFQKVQVQSVSCAPIHTSSCVEYYFCVNFAMANAYFDGAFSFRSVGQQYGFAISKLTELILA
jgi:hypothetical protein